MSGSLRSFVVVVLGLLATSSALADDSLERMRLGAAAADALAAVPATVRLSIDIEPSAFPEVQLQTLRDLELDGMKLAQSGQPAVQGDAATDLSPGPLVRVTSFKNESRVFWFSAGASAITSLATRVLLVIPTWVAILFAVAGSPPVLGPVAALVIVLGAVGALTVADSAASALVASLVFDNSSRFYTTSFLSSFGGHLAGNVLAAGVMWLSLGFGGMLLYGLDAISAFTTGAAATAIGIFSGLGVMPVLVVAFLASVALPSVIGTWAMASTAKPREGYVIDRTWKPLTSVIERALPEERDAVPMRTLMSVAIPGT